MRFLLARVTTFPICLHACMNNKNNFTPRHGSPLFSPTDPEKGFDAGGGGQSRRKFLKRTGGVTAAAALAWIPVRSDAHPGHGSSESWLMKWVAARANPEESVTLPFTLVGNTKSVDVFLTLVVKTLVYEDQALEDTDQIDYSASFNLQAHAPEDVGFPNEQCSKSFEISVFCNKANGHMFQSATQDPDSNGNIAIPTNHDFIYDGINYRLTLNGWIDTWKPNTYTTLNGGGHVFTSRSRSIGLFRIGVNVHRIPENNWQHPQQTTYNFDLSNQLQVNNVFFSYKV